MKIQKLIKKDRARIEKSRRKSTIRKLKVKKLKSYKATLIGKKTCIVRGLLFEKDVPLVVDSKLARYLRTTGFFKVEGVE